MIDWPRLIWAAIGVLFVVGICSLGLAVIVLVVTWAVGVLW